jgi:predicted lipid-binding transport protein (Tim44 family)
MHVERTLTQTPAQVPAAPQAQAQEQPQPQAAPQPPASQHITLPRGRHEPVEHGTASLWSRFWDSLTGGIIFALATLLVAIVALASALTIVTLLAVFLIERVTGTTV